MDDERKVYAAFRVNGRFVAEIRGGTVVRRAIKKAKSAFGNFDFGSLTDGDIVSVEPEEGGGIDFTDPVTEAAFDRAGSREKYAMLFGHRELVFINGRPCYQFSYRKDDIYRDADGATYDIETKKWIN